jgi:ABC-type ATPase involved in cell division
MRFDQVPKEYEKMFEWILGDQIQSRGGGSFKDWLSDGKGIFHFVGKPGSGKSTLMKFLCNDQRTEEALKVWVGDRELVFAKFFF